MNSGIYIIKNLTNSKIYVGSSINLHKREYKHFWMLDKGIHDNHYLQQSYNKNGKSSFIFEIVEHCQPDDLINKENHYIDFYQSNQSEKGFNLAKVNEFRRNTYNDEVKIRLSKYNLNKNNNISKFSLTNILTNESYVFDNLVDGANYLINNNHSKGSPVNVRQKLSTALRGKIIKNNCNGTVRKTIYKHKFELLS